MTHLDLKWIKRFERYLRLPDGTPIPRVQNKTMKEVIEDMHRTPGIIPMSKVQEKTSLYQDTAQVSSYVQAQSSEAEDLRALAELVQKIGIDQLQQLLGTTAGLSTEDLAEAEEESFTQNFN
jgi:hypothetical protein